MQQANIAMRRSTNPIAAGPLHCCSRESEQLYDEVRKAPLATLVS